MERYFKKNIVNLSGYIPPPQEIMRAKLNQNESPFDLPDVFKKEVLQQALTLTWNRYPVNESPVLKERLAEWHGVLPEQILLGNGSNQLLQTLLSSTIESGEKVLYFPPTFGLFETFTTVFSGKKLELFQSPEKPFQLAETLSVIKEQQPKMVLLCSPNNPTGAEMDLRDVETICRAASGLVFMDEAYGEFSLQTAIPLVQSFPQLIISRTFSKAFSLAGLRLGYLISSVQNIEQLRKANLPYNINLLTELIAERLLFQKEMMLKQVADLAKERDWLYGEMQKIKAIRAFPSFANFILFRCPDGKAVFNKLKEHGILVRDVSGYPLLKNHLRVSVGHRRENEWFLDELNKSLL
jgi:histidinol-phosphate aminotransferase